MTLFAALGTVWLGLLAGGIHAITGPDHMAAVAPFAARERERAWRVGFSWGLGHASGAALAALAALALRHWIPGVEEQLSAISERIVGIVLCIVGALGLRAALGAHSHAHPNSHARPAYFVGLLHGSAGLSHLFGVLPALAFPGLALPALYLAGYGLGSMILITSFAGFLGRAARDPARTKIWLGATSAASLLVGLVWIVHPF